MPYKILKCILIGFLLFISGSDASAEPSLMCYPWQTLICKKRPLSAKDFLANIKISVDRLIFVNEGKLQKKIYYIFGENYTYSKYEFDSKLKIKFDNSSIAYADNLSGVPPFKKMLPCLKLGEIFFARVNDKAVVNVSLVTQVNFANMGDRRIDADLAVEVLGKPHSIRPGYPIGIPSPHQGSTDLEKKTHIFGSSWLDYKFENERFVHELHFRTYGNGDVIEILISGKEK